MSSTSTIDSLQTATCCRVNNRRVAGDDDRTPIATRLDVVRPAVAAIPLREALVGVRDLGNGRQDRVDRAVTVRAGGVIATLVAHKGQDKVKALPPALRRLAEPAARQPPETPVVRGVIIATDAIASNARAAARAHPSPEAVC